MESKYSDCLGDGVAMTGGFSGREKKMKGGEGGRGGRKERGGRWEGRREG